MREWFLKHWRGVQAIFVLMAMGLAVVVTVRIVRPEPRIASSRPVATKTPLESALEGVKLSGYIWDEERGPDGSLLNLQTKCANGQVSYIFRVTTTPRFTAHYYRTYGNGARFELALLDSGGFKMATIPVSAGQLAALDSAGVITHFEAKDLIQFPCDEYLKLQAWEPSWFLAR